MKTKDRSYDVGSLKKRGTFEYYTTATDGLGGTSATWNTLDTVWIDIKPLSGSEAMNFDALKGNVKYRVITRYRGDFVSSGYDRATYDYDLRLKYNGNIYNIEYAIDVGEENTYTELIAYREVGDTT